MTEIRTYQTMANKAGVNFVLTAPTKSEDYSNIAECDRHIEACIQEMKKAGTLDKYFEYQQKYNYWLNLREFHRNI